LILRTKSFYSLVVQFSKIKHFSFAAFFSSYKIISCSFQKCKGYFFLFLKIVSPMLFAFETAVLLSAQIIYHKAKQLSKHFFVFFILE
ncbi:hypothetical protein BK119_17230, partial [Paenibacillus peoriae]